MLMRDEHKDATKFRVCENVSWMFGVHPPARSATSVMVPQKGYQRYFCEGDVDTPLHGTDGEGLMQFSRRASSLPHPLACVRRAS